MCNDQTFLTEKVTNRDIYKKLMSIEKQTKITNGTVGWHTKAIGGIFAIILGIITLCGGSV